MREPETEGLEIFFYALAMLFVALLLISVVGAALEIAGTCR